MIYMIYYYNGSECYVVFFVRKEICMYSLCSVLKLRDSSQVGFVVNCFLGGKASGFVC